MQENKVVLVNIWYRGSNSEVKLLMYKYTNLDNFYSDSL
ncbi:hypothetical protein SAMN04488698_13420 [Candidatus Frackibacter sp. WG12]|nr:hypothetical protein SAMN04515661_13221 [Candidatus Frackibacter sp. WG11]SEN00518.1 hypothetical protein SAMN04488698_13420 [Candidatus Frackibacter sp. WG12]SFL55678.1 hypothetical protein SAMN04488699_10594 [Candidatus Frackibacter sp. WG13]